MRPIYFVVGLLSLGLGVLGIFLPLLPTTPFLLLSIACFSRSSKRFENWLYHTKMYQIYVADFRETGTIAKERKKKIIVSIYILMSISIFLAPIIWVKIGLLGLTIFITYYLFKVIPDKEQKSLSAGAFAPVFCYNRDCISLERKRYHAAYLTEASMM